MGGVVEGVEAASRAYLGKPAQRLTASEAALLTVLPQAPSRLRPDRYPERARQARDKVLDRLQSRWGAAAIADARQEAVIAQSIREPLLAPLLAEPAARRAPAAAAAAGRAHRQHHRRQHAAVRRIPAGGKTTAAAATRLDGGAGGRHLDGGAGGRQPDAGSACLRRLGRFHRQRALCARGHGECGALARVDPETLPLWPGPRRRIDPFRVAARRRAAVLLGLSAGQFPGQLQRPGQRLRSPAEVAQRAGGGSPRAAWCAALRFPVAPRRPETRAAAWRPGQSQRHPRGHGGEPGRPGWRLYRPGPRRHQRPAALFRRRADRGSADDERRRRLHHPRRPRIRRPARPAGQRRRRHTPRRRLENRHQLRLPRRLGGRCQRPLHRRCLDRPARRHTESRLFRRQHRRPPAGRRLCGHRRLATRTKNTAGECYCDPHLLATRHTQRYHAARALPSGTNGLDSQRRRAADLHRPTAWRRRALHRLPRRRQRAARSCRLRRWRDERRRHGALASSP
ncbi:MAG: Penicillin-binding protein F [Candidatus Accumulibacter appositus]|uniref:Penicillin-binding protein F n=1 Tax=Candidatus Accumulibacter appositus TaxID=1454003 RepID=A0A011P323_9PROT|nr:MAG: Penicillin-binding protein F [Candidatus Accumulibacter appositus]